MRTGLLTVPWFLASGWWSGCRWIHRAFSCVSKAYDTRSAVLGQTEIMADHLDADEHADAFGAVP